MADREEETTFLGLSKCGAGKVAGFVTGLLAGIGVALALSNQIDPAWLRDGLAGLVILLAAGGGMLTGAIASGCYEERQAEPPEGAH